MVRIGFHAPHGDDIAVAFGETVLSALRRRTVNIIHAGVTTRFP